MEEGKMQATVGTCTPRGTKRKEPSGRYGKVVQFANQLEEIFTLPPVEDETVDEDGPTAAASATSNVKRTSEMTLLSSLHGRARRELREVEKFDLQAAIKYGVKSQGHKCPKTGLPRWKYVYGNLVFITDYTSTIEVTSYKQAISIQAATISSEMWDRHRQDSLILRQDPQLCATHSIVVIDQSGSMKTADVKGFRTRSQAAYGVLALEYVAEQLHQRGDDDQVLDAITVIEMNDTGTLVFEREPLDWLFFNKLLDRQQNAKPQSHGNYYAGLSAAAAVIHQEVPNLEDVDMDDLPSYALIFLSDGKPSDREPFHTQHQSSLLNYMVDKLQRSFSFHAIGLGQSTSDFAALENLAAVVRGLGSTGTFAHSSLNCVELSQAFSSVATSVTATRTEKVSTDGIARAPRVDKDVKLRSKHVPSAERKFQRKNSGVSRWQYDHQEYTARTGWPWRSIAFSNTGTVGFDMEKDPFGKGAERLAYMFYEIDHKSRRKGKAMVAKETRFVDDEERKVQFHEVFCRVQRQSNEYAEKFNNAVKQSPQLRPIEASFKTPDIRFLDCTVYEYAAPDGTHCGLLVEPFLKGKFTKYNTNNGYVKKATTNDRTLELQVGEVYMTDFLQAFSHWVYVQSDHKLLVCDLQGVLHEEGRYPRFDLTDPVICVKGRKGRKMYGKTNTGARGLRAFKMHHKCNGVCKGLGLPPFGTRRSQPTVA